MNRQGLKQQTIVQSLHMLLLSLLYLFPSCLFSSRWFSFLIALHLVSPHSLVWFLLCSWTNLLGPFLQLHSQVHTTIYGAHALQNLAQTQGVLTGYFTGKIYPGFLSILPKASFSFVSHGFQRASKLPRASPWRSSPNAQVKALVLLFLRQSVLLLPSLLQRSPPFPPTVRVWRQTHLACSVKHKLA